MASDCQKDRHMRRLQKILGEVSRYNAKIQSKGALRREKPSAENSPPLSRDQVQFISGRATAVNLPYLVCWRFSLFPGLCLVKNNIFDKFTCQVVNR